MFLKKKIVKEKYDLSFNRYEKEIFEEITYDEPKVILKKLKDIEEEIQSELKALNELF